MAPGISSAQRLPSCCQGPGYATPEDARLNGPREMIVYVVCVQPPQFKKDKKDYLATVDVDPTSLTYGQVIHRLYMRYVGDEIHHSGWNTCSSCHGEASKVRNRLILPALNSDRIYVVDVGTNLKEPRMHKIVEPDDVRRETGLIAPHNTHCLGNGDVMVSCLGASQGKEDKSGFLLLDGQDFSLKENWEKSHVTLMYDFWYQPRHNVMVSSELGLPRAWRNGFRLEDLEAGMYGQKLNVWDWTTHEKIQTIDMGKEGLIPLELRFLHDPAATEGYVACALGSNIMRFYKTQKGDWAHDKAIDVPSKKVTRWVMDDMPGLITDIVLSLDDRFIYFSNWIHGDIRQYDITDRSNHKMVGQIFLNGSIVSDGEVKVTHDVELESQPDPVFVQGKRLHGGPQMLQLSLDGKRLYVTNSLYSVWDGQFYPEMCRVGGWMLQIDVDTEKGGLTLNDKFMTDFGSEPDGPVLAHEIRYPGGDCTSDIWL